MSTITRPVGPKPPQVYWRRRALALGLAVLLVLALAVGVRALLRGAGDEPAAAQPGAADRSAETAGSGTADGDVAEGPTEAAGTDDESAATPSAGAGEPQGCEPDQVRVVATADATSYAAGTPATIGMRITNAGEALCTLDAGSAALELLVVSGSDRIWSSDDCQTDAQSRPTPLPPGEDGMLASSVEWPLVRSAAGCPEGLPALRPGTYQVTARAGEITSSPVPVTIE